MLTNKQRLLLTKLLNGDNPRCSIKEFFSLEKLNDMDNILQLSSAHGADISGGYVLSFLNHHDRKNEGPQVVKKLLK